MVGKLIKHELYSTVRIAAIPAFIMVLLAILSRILLATTSENLALVILMFYMFSVMATLLVGFFFGIQSFYQSLFTGTGYLTLSQPVTADQLIWSKLISAITVMFASIIVSILSACIFFVGQPAEFFESLGEAFSFIGETIEYLAASEPFFFVELVIYIILSVPMAFLIFYAVMSIGQLFTAKNRKGIAVLLYVGLIFVWSIFSSVALDPLHEKMIDVSIHLDMWMRILFAAAVDVGCYFLVRYIIKNKVNLLA